MTNRGHVSVRTSKMIQRTFRHPKEKSLTHYYTSHTKLHNLVTLARKCGIALRISRENARRILHAHVRGGRALDTRFVSGVMQSSNTKGI